MVVAFALAAAAGVWSAASAVRAQSLREMLGREKPRTAAVGLYVAAQGDAFILDRTNGVALLKFTTSAEIWALSPSHGPRGDVIYRNDVGEPMVRSTRLGGLTLFTADRPTGTPAAFDKPIDALSPPPVSPAGLLQRLAQASVRVRRATGRLVEFNAPDVRPGTEPLFADAANLVADGIAAAATTPAGKRRLARLRAVRLTEGPQAGARVLGTSLEIIVAPVRGLAGRPSSRRATAALVESR